MNAGLLVVFEGIDGSGKSTQLSRAARRVEAAGRSPVITAEPWTGGVWGPRIREMARSGKHLEPAEELRWFVEQRREHVREVIGPALEAGRPVICDRYTLSSVAYQGARGLDWRAILAESEAEFPVPDLALYFRIPAQLAAARLEARGGTREPVFEHGGFLARVAEVYDALPCAYLRRIDAALSEDDVARAVEDALEGLGLLS